MVTLNELRTDEKREREGVWFHFLDDLRLKIAAPSPEYRRELEFLRQRFDGDKDAFSTQLNKLNAKHLVLEWSGAKETPKGDDLPCTPDVVFDWLESIPALSLFVHTKSGNWENYRRGQVEEDEKN